MAAITDIVTMEELLQKADGEVTLAEYMNVSGDSTQWLELYPKLNNEALAYAVRAVLSHCHGASVHTYEGALKHVLVPELLKRLNSK